jgi:hypothetical protein
MARVRVELPAIIGILGLLVASNAAAQSYPVAGGPFDGTYGLVAAQNLNQTYVTRGGSTGFCQEQRPGPLMISQGQAWYTGASGRQLVGTINPQGEMVLGLTAPGEGRPVAVQVTGTVDAAGTAHVHQRGNTCSYYFTWQRQ